MSNALVKQFDTQLIDYSAPEVIKTLQKTVAQDTTPEEFAIFVGFCKSTGLNPLKREVWCIKAGGRLQMMTGINGYWSIANAHPQFDGMEGPDFEYSDKGQPISCTVKIYRKDRRFPAVGTSFLSEDAGSSPVWKQRPRVMLQKVAETRALRKAFPQELNGTYTEEEMPKEYSSEAVDVTPKKAPEVVQSEITREQAAELAHTIKVVSEAIEPLEFVSNVLDKQVSRWSQLSADEYVRCVVAVQQLEKEPVEAEVVE